MSRSTKFRLSSDLGSAVVEFTLLAIPIALVIELLVITTASTVATSSSTQMVREFADYCASADTTADDALQLLYREVPNWLSVVEGECTKSQPFISAKLKVAVRGFWPEITKEVIWHAASETIG